MISVTYWFVVSHYQLMVEQGNKNWYSKLLMKELVSPPQKNTQGLNTVTFLLAAELVEDSEDADTSYSNRVIAGK